MANKFNDLDILRQDMKAMMPLDQVMSEIDRKYAIETGNVCNPIERVNDHLFKKKCDLDKHPVDDDGTRDSTASFTICPQKELWYCFGCGGSGDRFEYISQRFHVEHIEAIKICAEIQGFDLTPYMVELTDEEKIYVQLFSENDNAREIAHKCLLDSSKAMDYLHGRGITDESIERFKIGYAPPLNNGKTVFDDIPNSITLQLNRRDQFNDSVLFPICDAIGRMRYFQARPFAPLPGMKYIGGTDSHPLYNEEDRLYGFDMAKRLLYKNGGKLIGVEGAPDTIACVQQGINACGFLGTVMNQNTFDILDRYRVTELILLLDGDKAGRDKTFKNSEKYLTLKTGVRLKVAILPDGYDPEEFINAFGVEKLDEIINDAVYAIQYLIDSKWNNATTPTGKIDFMSSISSYMLAITDKVIKQIMITHVAGKIGLDPVQIEDYIQALNSNNDGAKLFSIDGEEILLAEAMRDTDFIAELTVNFKDDDWYSLKHKHLFRILKSSEYTDIDSIYTVAKNMNVNNIITHGWLEKLYNNHGNVEFSLKDVTDKLIRRKSLEIIDRAIAKVNDMSTDIALTIDQSTTGMYNVIHKQANDKVFDAKQQVNNIMQKILDRMNNPVDIIGYSFGPGFEKLDKYTLALQKKTLTIVAANQSVGKTQICENWAMYQGVELNIATLWFSLEMDQERMTYRNLAILSGVSATDMMTGNITVDEKAEIDKWAVKLLQSEYYISEKGHDLSESLAIARRYIMRHHVKIIYVDYLQLQYVTDRRTETRSRELGTISKAWVEFSHDMDVPVVLISQLGKQALSADTAEAEHGFGSYEVAQDADNYYTLKDKDKEEVGMNGIEHGNKTLNISKNRMGEKGILVDIYSDGPTYRMVEV